MAKHFISVLGTGLYEPIRYEHNGHVSGEEAFIQAVLLDFMKEELGDDAKVTIFLTDGAKTRNWEERLYNETDVAIAQRWLSESKEKVVANAKKAGLEARLSQYKNWQIEAVHIADATTGEEIWQVYNTIYNSLEEGDEIIFDITHSFRSIPMLAITIINYARVMKKCKVRGIYYGAYEAAKKNNGIAPVVDLTMYNEILQWTSAAENFMETGNAEKMQRLYKEKTASIPNEEKREWSDLKNTIDAMTVLSDTLATCRGADNKDSKKSIKGAYQQLKIKDNEKAQEKAKQIQPLHQLMQKARESYSQFDAESNMQIGCEVVRWSIHNNMTQQGYTALEETIKTLLCEEYGLSNDKTDREDIVKNIMMAFPKKYLSKDKEQQYEPGIREALKKDILEDKKFGLIYTEACKENQKLYDKIIAALPFSLIQLSGKVSTKRNDINHFGFTNDVAKADVLKKGLQECFEEFERIIKEDVPIMREQMEAFDR